MVVAVDGAPRGEPATERAVLSASNVRDLKLAQRNVSVKNYLGGGSFSASPLRADVYSASA